MSVHTIIIDDEPNAVLGLKRLLAEYCPEIKVVGEAGNARAAGELIRESKPDLVFLDVNLQGSTGFDVIEAFPQRNFRVIFVTAFDEHIIRALRERASDYLHKPVNIDELQKAVKRIQAELLADRAVRNDRLTIATAEGFVYVNKSEIIRIEGSGSYSELHLAGDKRIIASKNIGYFDRLLSQQGFFRVHNSHMVNLSRVNRFLRRDGYFVEMDDSALVEISRRKKEEFLSIMGES